MKKESCDCVEREREEYKSGDMIKIPEEYQLLMRGHKQRIEACNTGIAALSAQLADAHREMWGFVEGMYPEFKRFSCQFDHVNMQVVLQRKLDDWEMSEWDKDKLLYKLWKEQQAKETGNGV